MTREPSKRSHGGRPGWGRTMALRSIAKSSGQIKCQKCADIGWVINPDKTALPRIIECDCGQAE